MDRVALVRRAKMAEAAGRWEDMVDAVSKLPDVTDFLVDEERNLFSIAFKHVVGTRRAALRIVNALIARHDGSGAQVGPREPRWKQRERVALKERIEAELRAHCASMLDLVTKKLLVGAEADSLKKTEGLVFFLKMAGDYHRYLTEFETGAVRAAQIRGAEQKYEQASKLAGADLPATHPLRLGLALNYAVFFLETKGEREQAARLARTAFDEAVVDLESLTAEQYKDSTLLLQLLRDNLALWGVDVLAMPERDTPADEDTAGRSGNALGIRL